MSRSGQDAGRPPLASIAAGGGRAAQVSRASTMARLQAWNKRQVQLLERKAERHAQRLERKARRLERQSWTAGPAPCCMGKAKDLQA